MQEAKVKREEKYVYLTSLGNAIITFLGFVHSSLYGRAYLGFAE